MNKGLTATILALAGFACANFDGVTEPIAQAKIGFTVPGKIDSIWVKEGAFVHKGDTLMNLVKTEEEIRVHMTKIIADDYSGLASSKAKMDTYLKDYYAIKKLYESSNSVSEEEVWEKQMNFDISRADWNAAKVTKVKDSLEYSMARAQLSKQYLIAPFDGEIVSIGKNNSESVEALEPIVEIADVRTCRMTAYIVANKAHSLKAGQKVKLSLDGTSKNRTRNGTIEFVSPVVDKSSLLRTVKIIFDNSDRSVEPGVTGKLYLK